MLRLIHHQAYDSQNHIAGYRQEIKRFLLFPRGQLYDWTDTIVPLSTVCQPISSDSIITTDYYQKRNLIPLTLSLEQEFYESFHEISSPFQLSDYPLFHSDEEVYFQYLLYFNEHENAFTISSHGNSYLALTTPQQKLKQVRSISMTETFDPKIEWINTHGTLINQQTINIYDEMNHQVDQFKLQDGKISSLRSRPIPVTIPTIYLDEYFPLHDETHFDFDSIPFRLDGMGKLKTLPPFLDTCLREALVLNGIYLLGSNYAIHHTAGGLTYLITYIEGNISGQLNLTIIDQNNIPKTSFNVAYADGDEGDYSFTKGYFINDSTYFSISKTCNYEMPCDSNTSILHIRSDGSTYQNVKEQKYFRVPY